MLNASRPRTSLPLHGVAASRAIEQVNGAPVLAVQWHPEWRASENPQSQLFFKLLGRALRREPLVQD